MKLHSGNRYQAVGAMSGTSLDGLDLAAAEFIYTDNGWRFSLIAAETLPYSTHWVNYLKTSPALPGEKLMELHCRYGRYTGRHIAEFIKKHRLTPELIASHGHTIFHQPQQGFNFQLGNGACIAAETGITTIADFRSGDVALGGQGAPLVPAGDRLLFGEYESCLNLGGFANISFEQNGERMAFDICPVNSILNHLALQLGFAYDSAGENGRTGKTDENLLEQLNTLPFYRQSSPKSLGREWMNDYFLPRISESKIPVIDKLRTVYEHIALQIANATPSKGKVLITGGGAFNTFLVDCLRKRLDCEIALPSIEIIQFKEALVFAFLGLLRYLGEINCYASVTGASKDSSTGVEFLG